MTPRHPPRALGSLTTPIRHRLEPVGRSQPTSSDPISHGPFLPLLECGPRLATLRPLAPSNDPHGPCGDGDCSPSPDGRGSKRSTFVDDLKIATIPPNSLLELVRTTELSKSGRGMAFPPSHVSRAAGRGATPQSRSTGAGTALRPGGEEGRPGRQRPGHHGRSCLQNPCGKPAGPGGLEAASGPMSPRHPRPRWVSTGFGMPRVSGEFPRYSLERR
jgi:hypothetical protein